MRTVLIATLVALCAVPVAAQHARERHPRPHHGPSVREQPRQHWRGHQGYRPYRGYGPYGYRPHYGFRPYGYGYGYGYRSAPLCTYWTPGYTDVDWYGNLFWVPARPFVAPCW